MKIEDIKPNPKNPRKITDKKLRMLKKSFDEFGDLSGIVFNKKTQQMIGGHQRSKLLDPKSEVCIQKVYKMPTKKGTVAEGYVEYDGEKLSYREVEWDKNKEKAANIAANKGAGEWDMKQLSEWMGELQEDNFDLELTMFDADELKQFKNLKEDENSRIGLGGLDEDEVPEKAPARTKIGDIFELGNHRLMCGDSTITDQFHKLMNGKKAKAWISDPPYGINHVEVSQEKGQSKGYAKIANDDLQDQELQDFIFNTIEASKPFLEKGFAFYMWHAMKMQAYFSQAAAAAAAAGILFHRQIIWAKERFVFGRGHYHWQHELCLMGWMVGNEPPFYGERNQTTIWKVSRENDKIHPTQKPVELYEIPIKNHLKENEIFMEPFGGSGSGIIAAEKTGTACYCMELDPHYCDVIIERWEKYTGKKAKLLNEEVKLRKAAKQVSEQASG